MSDRTGPRERRQYPQEFRFEAVRLADSIGINAAARRLDVPRATIGNWARRRGKVGCAVEAAPAAPAAGPIKRPVAELEAENARLRRELTSLKLDNEILRKAAAYFARESR